MPIYEIIDDQKGTFAGPVRVHVGPPPVVKEGGIPDPDYEPLAVTFIAHYFDSRQLGDHTPTLAAYKQKVEGYLDAAVERCQAEAELKGWAALQPGQIRYAPEQDRKVQVRESDLEAMRKRIAELEAAGREEVVASIEVVQPEEPRTIVKERAIRVSPEEAKRLKENRKTYSSGPCEVCGKLVPLNAMLQHWRLSGERGKTMREEHASRYALWKAERDAARGAA